MPLPDFNESGWLPAGHYAVTWEEVDERFGGVISARREILYARLRSWADTVLSTGLHGTLILDGSFISRKLEPGDVDCLFVFDEASEVLLKNNEDARGIVDYSACKKMGLGDVFVFSVSTVRAYPSLCPLTLFDFDKNGQPKGVLEVTL